MKTINLFLKAHFTSLSPDGQFISLAIVSEEYFNESYRHLYSDKVEIKKGNCSIDHLVSKSFYAEFSDFEINRCDDWVKENVISKLKFSDKNHLINSGCNGWSSNPCHIQSNTGMIKETLTYWLSQFSDYKINFVVDCGWFCWGKFVELMGEWETKRHYYASIDINSIPKNMSIEYVVELWNKEKISFFNIIPKAVPIEDKYKIGLPKLPANFPPVPQDLNELIAFKKGISVGEAFELDREEYLNDNVKGKEFSDKLFRDRLWSKESDKFNAFWDAKVTKGIFNKLV